MCDGFRAGSITASARTQSSIAVSSDGVDWILFNTSPDILTQLKSTPALQPARGVRDTGIKSVFLLDSQIDHTTGLLMLREHSKPLDIWCTAQVQEDLTSGNPLFNVLSHYCDVNWKQVTPGELYTNVPGATDVQIEVMPLTSNAPPYSPRRDKPVPGDTIGICLTDINSGKKTFYRLALDK